MIQRQTSNPPYRAPPKPGATAVDKPRPKWNGNIKVKNSGSFAVEVTLDHNPSKTEIISSFLDSPDLTVNKVVPFRSIKYLYRSTNHFRTEIKINDSDYIHWSKFARFLYVNRQAAVVQAPTRPKEFLILTNTFRNNWTLEKPELSTAIYLNSVESDYGQQDIPSPLSPLLLDSHINWSWKSMASLLMFPEELAYLIKRKDIEFQVIGSSGLARNLRSALKSSISASTLTVSALERSASSSAESLETLSPLASSLIETKNILLIDRSGDRLYRTPLKTERKSNDTIIFQFGSPRPTEPITAPSIAYPKNTGGFITTDVKNILKNPDILDRIVDFAKKKNGQMLGTWKPILHTECLQHIMRSGTGLTAQNAISKILAFLISKDIGILENWGEMVDETKWKTASLDWFDTIARTNVSELEAFLFVDDGPNSPPWYHYYPAIDFINSDALLV